MSQRPRTSLRTSLLVISLVVAAGASVMLNACQNSADGVTPSCGPAPDYDSGAPLDPASYDPDCYTAPGDAGVLVQGTGGAGGSG